MLYEGTNITVTVDADGIAEFCYDAAGSVNKFDLQTLNELDAATRAIADDSSVKGVLVYSAKPAFIVGADILGLIRIRKPEFAATTRPSPTA